MFSKGSVSYKFILFVILFLVADFVIDNINHRFLMPDFKVYYGAARAITSGKQVYGTLFSLGSGYYKYAPFIALLFYPLSILSYYASCVVFFILISTAIIVTSITILHILNTYIFKQSAKSPNAILSLSVVCIFIHLIRELGLGNVNMFLLLFLCLTLYFTLQRKMVLAGILLALILITKPFFIILFIPLIMRRYFKTVLTAIILLGAFIILPSLLIGISSNIELHNQWLNTMLIHAGSFPSPNTIESFVRDDLFLPISGNFQYIIIALFLGLYIYYIRRNNLNERTDKTASASHFVMEWFVLIAMTPSLFKTDTEHFLLTLPIIIFIMIYLFDTKNITITIFFIVLILLYAGNSSDLLGAKLSNEMYNTGVLGISNVLLVALALFIYTRKTFNQVDLSIAA